ncbi:hypothetical protein ATCC90586_007271 [Pythium insidiosum]|nr:hypothetical protein ATCC90586_007271 [Pythium insidiosum]
MKVAQPALGPFVSLHRHVEGCVPDATGPADLPPLQPCSSNHFAPEPSSFCALLEAASSVDALSAPASPSPSSAAQSIPSTPDSSPSNDLRRQRNRISCRKTRLKRKLEQANAAILNRHRQERHQYLLDLRDELEDTVASDAADANGEAASSSLMQMIRSFVANTLHYSLMDSEYLDTRRSLLSSKCRQWWPKRSVMQTLLKQWRRLTQGLCNVDLLSVELQNSETFVNSSTMKSSYSGDESVLMYEWKCTGLTEESVSIGRPKAVNIVGTTQIHFIGFTVHQVDLMVKTSSPQKPAINHHSSASAFVCSNDVIYC